jgi:hypothetical protein
MAVTITSEAGGANITAGLTRGGRYKHLPIPTQRKVLEAARMYDAAYAGNYRAIADFTEALTRSDFSYLFGVAMDKALLDAYEATPSVWTQFATATTVRDFKAKKLEDLLGGRGYLDEVEEGAQYPQGTVSDAEYSITAKKYGRRIGITWEATVNDDLDALRTLPNRLATAARITEDKLATGALVTATGPDSTFFASGHSNLISGNPVLTQANLASAIATLLARLDTTDSIPIIVPKLVLMVPPALQMTAEDIVQTTQRRVTASSTESLVAGNGLPIGITVVVNPYISAIDVSATKNTTWYLLPAPDGPRPAVAAAKLRGHETPDLRLQNSTGVRVGGGTVDPSEGSFEIDAITYRVRHVFGAANVDWTATYASTGAGS